jgi:hypothetical protein
MKIAYCRMSGPIGLTSVETGTRGLWFEKRKALVRALMLRGHTVDFVSRFTRFTAAAQEPVRCNETHELLMVEFGSSNRQFYAKDLDAIGATTVQHVGPIVFVCDDPDLPYVWSGIPADRLDRWTVWMNATRPQAFAGMPTSMRVLDAPFASLLQPAAEVSRPGYDKLVYIGRTMGRDKVLKALTREASEAFVACGRPAEWTRYAGTKLMDSPPQTERSAFYRRFLGSLVLADAKHKRLGWRTGRAYHALYAGCPAVVETDHDALPFARFGTPAELRSLVALWRRMPEVRQTAWETQLTLARADVAIMNQTFAECGL